jgi:hypothetical protein
LNALNVFLSMFKCLHTHTFNVYWSTMQ